LKVAWICAIPSDTFFFTLLRDFPTLFFTIGYYFRIGRRGPFRVLALVDVRCPRTGSPRL
jgi:hypothetical protein